MPKKEIETAVAMYDLHFPQHHKPTLDAILDFLKRNPVDIFVFGGDALDMAELSHHNKHKGLYKLPGSYKRNIDSFRRDVLNQIEARLSKDCKKIWLTGNHEFWAYEMVEEHPELQGSIEPELLLGLEQRGWKVIPFGHSFKYGELTFIHGQELGGCGNQNSTMHAKKAVEVYCTNVLYGHYHAPQCFTKVLPTDQRRKWQAHCSPIAGSVNPQYLEHRPTAWLNGFSLVEFRSNGEFCLFPIICIDGVCSYGGKLYGARKRTV